MYTLAAVLAVVFLQFPQSIPAGTPITARLETTVNTASSQQGDEISAAVVKGLPGGSRLRGRIETIQAARRDGEGRELEARLGARRSAGNWDRTDRGRSIRQARQRLIGIGRHRST